MKQPSLTRNFIAALDSLGDDKKDYYRFLDSFGTHYIRSIRLGSKYGYRYMFTDKDVKRLENDGISVSGAASVSTPFFKAGASASLDMSEEKKTRF